MVYGVLKQKTEIVHAEEGIAIGYCQLEYRDTTLKTRDAVSRQAETEFLAPAFSSITGISGSPVFDKTAGKLCGMVVRGGMVGKNSCIRFIDMFDIAMFLEGMIRGLNETYYVKNMSEYIE